MTSGEAVVIGAGIGGLLAATVLADAGFLVTIVERDREVEQAALVDSAAGSRRGVPQGPHLHGLLDGGRRLLEDLYPGLTDELVAAGAPSVEPLRDTRWYLHGRRLAGHATGMRSVLATRPFLEDAIRARVLARPGVALRGGRVVGLIERGCHAVGGVVVRDVGGGDVGGRDVGGRDARATGDLRPADLVVDCSGRASRLPTWLARLGHPAPVEERVDVDLGYATRLYRRVPAAGFLGVTISTVPRFRGGGCVAVEGGRWLVTLAGSLGDHPPTDPDGFTAWAATLPAPDIAEVVRHAEPLGDPQPHRFRGSRWRRYDRVRLPAGVIALGDAVCSVNPLYAQGMTLAAQQVGVLRDLLRAGLPSPSAFQRATAPLCRAAWDTATRADLALPEVPGRHGPAGWLLDRYVRRVQLAAHHDPRVARTLLRVANLADPPSALLQPGMVLRALARGGPAPTLERTA